jgi:hypothetical protein
VVQRVAEKVITQGDIDSAARYVWRKPDYSSVKPIALRSMDLQFSNPCSSIQRRSFNKLYASRFRSRTKSVQKIVSVSLKYGN